MPDIDLVRPRLHGTLQGSPAPTVELATNGDVVELEPPEGLEPDDLYRLLQSMDGARSASELARTLNLPDATVDAVVRPGLAAGVIDDATPARAATGLAALSRLEGLIDRLLQDLVFEGRFWRAMTEAPEDVHHNVFYGFGLENWFFLFHENEFDSAVLAYPSSDDLRVMMNDFYQEEHRHDDIVVRAFEPLGITPAQLRSARPLPTTTALIKLLSWWARTDPLFFLATIGVLEGRLDPEGDGSGGQIAYDSFLAAADKVGLPAEFVEPLRRHARVNAGHEHSAVSRELFERVDGVDAATEQRWQGKAHLFVETYAAYYDGILDYYSQPGRPLLRTLPPMEVS